MQPCNLLACSSESARGEIERQSADGYGCVLQTVDFDSFSKVLNRPGGFRDPGEPEEYCRGFQVFDKDMTGFIGVGQLRYSSCLSRSARAIRSKRNETMLTTVWWRQF